MIVPFQFLLRDALRFRKLVAWLILAVAGFALAASWHYLSRGSETPITATDRYVNVVNLLVFRLLPLASAIYTTMVVSQEVEQKTIVYLLTRPLDRWQLLVGRWMATVTAVLVISLIGMVATILGAGGFGQVHVAFPRDLLAIFLGAAAYGSLFLFVTLVFNRALIVCVLFAFGWESSVPNLSAGLQKLSILAHMQAIANHPDSQGGKKFLEAISGVLGENTLSGASSAFTLIVFSVVMVGLSAYWFTTNEYIPREDSE
ncbi:MAG: ABC transporter permease [Armatimonadetes bacterium]|nr:ABC transporter permease [Armatimonadota bacterium]MBS1725160.1 ABC transporter permease [Armatimonadota bacterium]